MHILMELSSLSIVNIFNGSFSETALLSYCFTILLSICNRQDYGLETWGSLFFNLALYKMCHLLVVKNKLDWNYMACFCNLWILSFNFFPDLLISTNFFCHDHRNACLSFNFYKSQGKWGGILCAWQHFSLWENLELCFPF